MTMVFRGKHSDLVTHQKLRGRFVAQQEESDEDYGYDGYTSRGERREVIRRPKRSKRRKNRGRSEIERKKKREMLLSSSSEDSDGSGLKRKRTLDNYFSSESPAGSLEGSVESGYLSRNGADEEEYENIVSEDSSLFSDLDIEFTDQGVSERGNGAAEPDEEGVVQEAGDGWNQCMAPDDAEALKVLGEAEPKSRCFGCMRGRVDQPATSYEKWNEFISLFKEGLGYMDPIALSLQLEKHYEYKIRRPGNASRKSTQSVIPQWNAATIYAHFNEHMIEPSFVLWKRLRQVSRLVDSTYRYVLWESSQMNSKVKRPRIQKAKGDPDCMKQYAELVRLERQLYSSKPSKMFLHNPSLCINFEFNTPFINPNKPMYMKGVKSEVFKTKKRNIT